MITYLSLFAVAFAAASLLPLYSEVYLAALVTADYDPTYLWTSATLGNTLGSFFNYVLARYALKFRNSRWFPMKDEHLAASQRWFDRYGKWSLLFAWAPIGGDALTFIAGLMKVNIPLFFILVGLGKGARYALVIWTIL